MAGRMYTIGYGGRTPEDVLEQLAAAKVQFVIDVRSSPYSRFQPDFSQGPLEGLLKRNNVKYVFMGDDLGGRPKDPDCYSDDGKVDYTKCRTKVFFQRGIARLRSAYDQGLHVCLLCSEGKPWQCHRSKLLGAALHDSGVEVLHLLPDGATRTQEEVIRKLTGGQADLFGEHFVSRKAYLLLPHADHPRGGLKRRTLSTGVGAPRWKVSHHGKEEQAGASAARHVPAVHGQRAAGSGARRRHVGSTCCCSEAWSSAVHAVALVVA